MLRNEIEAQGSEGNNIIDARDEDIEEEIAGQLSESHYDDGNFLPLQGMSNCGETNLQEGWK